MIKFVQTLKQPVDLCLWIPNEDDIFSHSQSKNIGTVPGTETGIVPRMSPNVVIVHCERMLYGTRIPVFK